MMFFPLLLSAVTFAAPTPEVLRFTPEGDVKKVQQVRVEFSQPMLRFGQPRAEAPITGDCLKDGEGRWVDPKNWVFDFKKSLPGGLRCSFQIRSGLTSLEGVALRGAKSYAFTTGGPGIVDVFPETWRAIEEEPIFILSLDAAVREESLKDRAFLAVEGLGDRIALEPVSSSVRARVLEAFWNENPWKARRSFRRKDGALVEKAPVLVVKSARRLPYGAKVMLVWEAGILSATGVPVSEIQRYEYNVRPDFRAEFSCPRSAPGKPCIPLLGMSLSFTEGIRIDEARKAYLENESGQKRFAKMDESRRGEERTSWLEFPGPFPENAKFSLHLPKGLKDESGRPLSNADRFPLEVGTDQAPPLLKFAAQFGVIEAGPEAALPVTVRDVEARLPVHYGQEIFPVKGGIERLDATQFSRIAESMALVARNPYGDTAVVAASPGVRKIEVPRPLGGREFEVLGIPFEKPGFYMVEVASPRLGASLLEENKPYFVRSTVLVTRWAVHLKYASDAAFVWVTKLEDSTPIAGATVRLLSCSGAELGLGTTGSDGTVRIAAKTALTDVARCGEESWGREFFALAEKDGEFSFTSSSWDKGIEPWRFRVNTASEPQTFAHTILDRNLLRPGETVSMKHVLRKGTMTGFDLVAGWKPIEVVISHESGLQEFKLPLKWNNAMGTAESQWKIPQGARLGHWSLRLADKERSFSTVTFRVENYKVPLLKGHIRWPSGDLIQAREIPVNLAVEYLAGGAAGGLDVKLRWKTEAAQVEIDDPDADEFAVMNGGLEEGVVRNRNRSAEDEEDEDDAETESLQRREGLKLEALRLDAQGTGSVRLSGLERKSTAQNVRLEAEYRDPNGDIQTVDSSVKIWPSSWIVGIRARGWFQTKDRVEFEALVLDLTEKPVVGAEVEIDIYKQDTLSHRKRLIGGFYTYESATETKKIGRLCSGKTDARGRLVCSGSLKIAGSVSAVARAKDPAGRWAAANARQWIIDDAERVWFGSSEGDRMDLIPSKKSYEPGETAEFQVQMPFKSAKILLTVEREGVIEHRIIDVNSSSPVLKLPIKESWAPNVFVSALAIRGRVDGTKPTALLDLGKPAYKMGLVDIRVGWKKHELKVSVDTDRKTVPVRGKTRARVKVSDANGKPVSGEISLAVVDEGLLLLQPNGTWKILEAMMGRRSLLLQTATAQTQVVGKRHYGRKVLASGGDGGGSAPRDLFETLLLWKGTVKLNAQGEAFVDITANDSLTSFRVVAIALNGRDQFGSGWTSFRTTQDLMVFAGTPELVREGDVLSAEFNLRNATSVTKDLDLKLESRVLGEIPARRIQLRAGESAPVRWEIRLPSPLEALELELIASENGKVLDRLKKKISVQPVWPVRVQQATLRQINGEVKVPVLAAAQTVPGTSGVRVDLSSSLVGNRDGLIDYWKNYRFNCLEQMVSRIVTLNERAAWEKLENELSTYLDSSGRLKYFPSENQGSSVLTSYVMSTAHEAGFAIRKETRDRMGAALTAFISGKLQDPDQGGFPDIPLRKISAFEALSRYRVFDPSLLSGFEITPNFWPSSSLIEWISMLRREGKIPERGARLAQAEQVVRSRMSYSGGRFAFSDSKTDSFWWLMRDSEWPTSRLILAVIDDPAWAADIPGVMRGLLEKQERGSWGLTTSNAWGRLAMDRYKSKFEKAQVTGRTRGTLKDKVAAHDWSRGPRSVLELPGTQDRQTLSLRHEGAGAPWGLIQWIGAVPVTKSVYSGFDLQKTMSPLVAKSKDVLSRGDVLRVRVKFSAKHDNSWVVLEDPLPAGAVVLGSGLGNDSALLGSGPSRGLTPTFEERRHEAVRFYFSWLPAGTYEIEYRVRLNAAGTFQVPSTRVEAMYNPDLFGEIPNASWVVVE